MPPRTPTTITSKAKLKDALAQVRQLGYAYDNEESEPGVWAVASCVRNAEGQPAAAISIVVPIIRVTEERIPEWTKLIVEGAEEISSKLSFPPLKSLRE